MNKEKLTDEIKDRDCCLDIITITNKIKSLITTKDGSDIGNINVDGQFLIDILNLINRLKEENETLRKAKVVTENVDYCAEDLSKALKDIAELKAENERLKIPENNIVLTREEYNELLARPINAMGELVISKIKNNKE